MAVLFHSRNGAFPIPAIGKIEDHEVILGRSSASRVPMRAREFKVIRLAGSTKHDTVEPIVVFEAMQFLQAEPLFVKANYGVKIVRGSGDAKYG